MAGFWPCGRRHRFTNQGVHVISLRWGRTTAIRIYCDTALLTQWLERNAACGVAEAVAAPIVDEP